MSPDTQETLERARVIALAAVPFAFLAGLLRSRVAGAVAVSELVAGLGAGRRRGELRDALAEALGDRSLQLAYWLPERREWVDAAGASFALPARMRAACARPSSTTASRSRCSCTTLRWPMSASGSARSAELPRSRWRTSGSTPSCARNVHELRASRVRIVESADAARRRIERDLHDGAQQQLVALAIELRTARSRLERDPRAAAELLDAAARDLEGAIRELRELARGIHPAVLSDRGLRAALEALAQRIPLPVEIDGSPEGRLPETVEAAVYFVVAEALTNVTRYARAGHARVAVTRNGDRVVVEVADDGIGGADPANGTGLRGLVDRVAALDGRFDVDSPRGGGTADPARSSVPAGDRRPLVAQRPAGLTSARRASGTRVRWPRLTRAPRAPFSPLAAEDSGNTL